MNRQVVILLLMMFMIFIGVSGPALAVDGVVEINQARANVGGVTPGDAPGFPVTISTPGSYRLTGSLTITASSTDGIEITSDDVTIDLNGFTIAGPGNSPTSGRGINAGPNSRTTVINGIVRGMNYGIELGAQSRISDVHVFDNNNGGIGASGPCIITNNTVYSNSFTGISVGNGCVLIGNTAYQNGNDGIAVGDGSLVKNNTAYLNGGYGFDASGSGETFIDNVARDNTSFGIRMNTATGYKGNVMTGNNGGNANPQVSGGVQYGTNVCATNTTCP